MATAMATIASAVSIGLFLWAFVLCTIRTVKQLTGPALPDQAVDAPIREDYGRIAVYLLISSLVVYGVGTLCYCLQYGMPDGLWAAMKQAFVRADALHYTEIATNGYAATGETRYFIVFFPLFPLAMRALAMLIGDYFLSAILVNHLFLYLACVYLYKLGCLDYGRDIALRAVRYILVFPVAFFFRIPYTESLFLLVSVLCFYHCRKNQCLCAGFFGLLAALTRMTGILCVLPIGICAILEAKRQHSLWIFWKKASCALLVVAGTGIYLLLNQMVTGDSFRFLYYQQTHWYNGFSLFPSAVYTVTDRMLTNIYPHHAALWISQFSVIFLMLGLTVYGVYRLRNEHSVYNISYFFSMISASWLLSGPRYLMCMFPAFYAIAMLTKKKWIDRLCLGLSTVCLLLMSALFCLGHSIY